jgi:hypothetical protein
LVELGFEPRISRELDETIEEFNNT